MSEQPGPSIPANTTSVPRVLGRRDAGAARDDPTDSWVKRVAYDFARVVVYLFFRLMFRTRAFGQGGVPASGPVLIAANHQSYLDPPVVSVFIHNRRCHFVARLGLFRFKPLGWLISLFNSIPIGEGGGDLPAIKEILRRLGLGHAVIIFPEGTRTPDGAMHEFKRGVALLVKRARCPVVPVAIEGAYDAWPTGRPPQLFQGHRVFVRYGEPIPYDELMKDGADAALATLHARIDAMRAGLRREIDASLTDS